MEKQTEENVFGPAPESPPDLIEQIDEAVWEYWNNNLSPVGVIWIDREAWFNLGLHDVWYANEFTWLHWGCRAVLLDDFFKDKEFKFALKP